MTTKTVRIWIVDGKALAAAMAALVENVKDTVKK